MSDPESPQPIAQRASALLADLIARADRYPRPKWDEIAERIAQTEPTNEHAVWWDVALGWVEQHCAAAGKNYWCTYSQNFLLASPLSKRQAENLLVFSERARRGITKALVGLAGTYGFGPHVVLLFATEEEYYDYIGPFYPDGAHYAASSGVHLDHGYGHFALPPAETDFLESVVAHELTHALVSHLPLPRWLNEGMAVNLESALCPRFARKLELGWLERHQIWWDSESVQKYWSGQAFRSPDKLSALSYELAWVTVRSLAENYEVFRLFVSEATYEDAGQSASHLHFGHGLGLHFEPILGEGNWDPDPSAWSYEKSADAA